MKRKRENRGKEDSHEAIGNVEQKECVSQRRVKDRRFCFEHDVKKS